MEWFGSAELINVISGRWKIGSQGNQRRKSCGKKLNNIR